MEQKFFLSSYFKQQNCEAEKRMHIIYFICMRKYTFHDIDSIVENVIYISLCICIYVCVCIYMPFYANYDANYIPAKSTLLYI